MEDTTNTQSKCPFDGCTTAGSNAGVKRHMIAKHHEDWRTYCPDGSWPRTRSSLLVAGGQSLVKIVAAS